MKQEFLGRGGIKDKQPNWLKKNHFSRLVNIQQQQKMMKE